MPDESARHNRAAWTGFPPQGKGHHMAHGHIGTKVQIDVWLLINRLHAYAVTLLHRPPSNAVLRGIAQSTGLAPRRTRRDHDLQLGGIIMGRSDESDHIG